jgi:hypothetical protein
MRSRSRCIVYLFKAELGAHFRLDDDSGGKLSVALHCALVWRVSQCVQKWVKAINTFNYYCMGSVQYAAAIPFLISSLPRFPSCVCSALL